MALWDFFKKEKKNTSCTTETTLTDCNEQQRETFTAEQFSGGFDEDFMGEHFEGLGNIWEAFFEEGSSITDELPTIFDNGKVHPRCNVRYEDGSRVVLLQYPGGNEDMQAGALFVRPANAEETEFWSGAPVMKGLPNTIKIKKRHDWSNLVEGVVLAEIMGNGPVFSFYAPFYFRDFAAFVPDTELTVYLSALSLTCRKAEAKELTVEKGPYYEEELQAFLKENPNKTERDFADPTISFVGSKILLPAAYVCESEYRAPIEKVEATRFLGRLVCKLQISFVSLDEQKISVNIYVPAHQLGEYVPQVSDDIEGVLWMTGSVE